MIDFDDEGVSIVDSYIGDQGFRFPEKPHLENADELDFMSTAFIMSYTNDPRIDEW